jgi:FKBP-type peptidyl-prolyl cis-trans isomerase
MKIFKNTLILAMGALLLSLSSCIKTKEPIADTKAKENDAAIQAYLAKNNITAQKSASNIYYVINKTNASGRSPVLGDLLTYHFLTSRLDGFKIDSTSVKDNLPGYTPYGTVNSLFGLLGSYLKEGETATFYLPYNYGYGDADYPNVPAYSPIIMNMSVLKIKNEDEQINSYIEENKLVTQKTTSGLRYAYVNKIPAGDSLKAGQLVTLKYTGKFLYYSGLVDAAGKSTKIFDSGTFSLTIGAGSTVAGFEEGVRKFKVGEKGVILFPSSLGYGDAGSKNSNTGQYSILPKSPLLFEIEIVSSK